MNDKIFNLYDLLAEDLAFNIDEAKEYLQKNDIYNEAIYKDKMSGLLTQVRAYKFNEGKNKQELFKTKLETFLQLIQDKTHDKILEMFPPLASTAYSQLSNEGISETDIEILKQDSSFLSYLDSIQLDDFNK